jgi:SPASM domain peptide maturase of grasp-with-spasm system
MMPDKNNYLKLYAHNIAVRGNKQSAIYNLQDQKIIPIPNILYKLILKFKCHPVKVIQDSYGIENKVLFDRYLEFLLKSNLAFLTPEPDSFPEIEQTWCSPEIINNAIIAYDFEQYDIGSVIDELHTLGCKHLELRLTLPQTSCEETLCDLFNLFNNKVFNSLIILIEYNIILSLKMVESIYARYSKITCIIIYNCKKSIAFNSTINEIRFIEENLSITQFNNPFPSNKLFVNRQFFMESLNYNVFYNKKICINNEGEIKNHLQHKNSFGNVNDVSLNSVINKTNFKELWEASNDKIEDIKDSELRYCMFISNELIKLPNGNYKIIN